MAGSARPCPTPHPLRAGFDSRGDLLWAPTLELIGGYEDSFWMRCRACGAWFWVVCDTSRFSYQNEWRLPSAEAERALLGHEPASVVALLVGHGLPHGPLWELASARVGLLRTLTPGHDDRERIAALHGQARLDSTWTDALALLIDELAATQRSVVVPQLEFMIDLQRDMSSCDELFELPGALIAPLREPASLLRFSEPGGVEIPLAGPPRLLASQPESLLFFIEGPTPSLLMLRPETMLALPLSPGARLLGLALDRGHCLLIPDPEPTPEGPRRVELRDERLEFAASLPMQIEPRSPYPCAPRAMAGGWLFSNVVDDAGELIGLSLFDDRWQVAAHSRAIVGARSCDPIDDERLLAVPLAGARLEGWRRVGDRLERRFDLGCHAHVRVGERIVAAEGGYAFGLDLAGRQTWRRLVGPLNLQMIALGPTCVLICGDRLLELIEPETGKPIARVEGAIDDEVFVDRAGWAHLMFGATLISVDPRGTIERTPLDGEYSIVGGAGIGVVLRRDDEGAHHLWIACTGEPIAAFEAPDARWSVVGSVAGPHVLEPGRLRIHRLPAG
ncbi:hypothetical protein ACNOYE_23410 [Nannocystaceae bacterium ST9]